jgi:polar amino acid transport system substrate-binding protein
LYHRTILSACLVLTSLAFAVAPIRGGDPPQKSLRWGADAEGGVPYVFEDPDKRGGYLGFEVDLARALEKQLDQKIEFKQYNFDTLLDGLKRGDFDFIMNGFEITAKRKQRALFCRPYYIYKLQLIVRDDEDRFQNLEECKGKHFAIGTLEATAAEQLLDNWQVPKKTYPDQEGPFKDLLNRRLDGVLFDLPIAIYYAKPDAKNKYAKKLKGLKFAGPPLARGYYGIAVRPEDKELANRINNALDRLLKSGELEHIYTRWDLWNDDQESLRLASVDDVDSDDVGQWTFDKFFPLLLDGAVVTVEITLASMLLAIAVGLVVALCRMYGGPLLSPLALIYVEFFRGIPALLLLYFLYFGLPSIAELYELPVSLNLSPWTAAILGLGLNYAAYEAEIYRAAIRAIPQGQWEAAASLGMPGPLTFRRIILPQAIRGILPPMTNDFVALFKDTSLVSVIAVVELNKQYQILTKSGGDFLQIGLATAVLYLVMSVPLGLLSRYLEKRWCAGHQ